MRSHDYCAGNIHDYTTTMNTTPHINYDKDAYSIQHGWKIFCKVSRRYGIAERNRIDAIDERSTAWAEAVENPRHGLQAFPSEDQGGAAVNTKWAGDGKEQCCDLEDRDPIRENISMVVNRASESTDMDDEGGMKAAQEEGEDRTFNTERRENYKECNKNRRELGDISTKRSMSTNMRTEGKDPETITVKTEKHFHETEIESEQKERVCNSDQRDTRIEMDDNVCSEVAATNKPTVGASVLPKVLLLGILTVIFLLS